MTTPEVEAEILRLYYAEHWRVGTIAAQLGVHPDVVRRVLGLGCSVHPLSRQCRRRKSGELSGTVFASYAALSTARPSFSARYSAGVFHPSA